MSAAYEEILSFQSSAPLRALDKIDFIFPRSSFFLGDAIDPHSEVFLLGLCVPQNFDADPEPPPLSGIIVSLDEDVA